MWMENQHIFCPDNQACYLNVYSQDSKCALRCSLLASEKQHTAKTNRYPEALEEEVESDVCITGTE